MNTLEPGDEGLIIPGSTTIEEALQIFAETAGDKLIITDRKGHKVGRLTVEDLIRGIRRPTTAEIQAERRLHLPE
jgi:CBS-domain-containing membrane protein